MIDISLVTNGVAASLSVPSSQADTNWAYRELVWKQSLATAIQTTQGAWTALPLHPDWVAGSSIEYRKSSSGVVYLRGFGTNGGGPPGVVGTLPAGFRPPVGTNFTVIGGISTTPTTNIIYIDANGVIYFFSGDGFGVDFGPIFFSVTP